MVGTGEQEEGVFGTEWTEGQNAKIAGHNLVTHELLRHLNRSAPMFRASEANDLH